jgi:putative nucleic acid binding protein
MFGQTSVTLKGKDMSLVSVQCFFEDEQKAALANLKKGQQVTIQGVCDGKSMNVSLKKCVVK